MWQENLILFAILAAGLSNLCLAVYVYLNGPKQRLNRSFTNVGIIIFLWCLANFVSILSENIFWLRTTYAFGLLVSLFSLYMTSALSDKVFKKSWLIILNLLTAILFLACYSPFFLSKIISYGTYGLQAEFGPLFILWEIYMIIVSLLALYLPVRVLPQMDERRRKQIGYFYVGCFLYGFWSFTVSVALPFFGNFNLSNLDTPSTIFLTGFVSYSIIKYQIMDIKYLILKAFIYALLIGLISSFLAILLSLESWFFENYGVSSVYLITAFVSIIIFLIGRSFYIKTKDLELAKNSLTQLLEKSEENRLKAEVEKNKTLAIIKNFSDGLLILDKSRRIIIVNQAMENYLGFEASGLLGKKLGAKSLAKVSRLNLLSLSILGREKELRKKEIEFSSNQIMELSTVRLKFEKKNNGLLVILHDVTSRRNIERLKSEFVTLAAHQMRTPLTAIRWSSQMFLKGDLGVLNDEQQEYLQKIEISSSRMIKLINDLLDVGHLDDGNYVLNVSSFKVSDVFSVVMSNLKEKIEQKKIETNILFPDFELPLISADREKIGIVMQNLIENAINYSKEGGKIAIAVDCNQENWSFKVEDSGIGISEKSKGRIFGKFFRSEEAFKQSTEGSGLGLFMCKNIIESHGGRIGFESVEGLGSTFFFSLPLKAYVKLK